jgi:DmsE family decaheme c-type cytochrome
MRRIRLLMVLAMTGAATAALAGDAFMDAFDIPADAAFTGSASCLDCHDDLADAYAHSPHAADLALGGPGTAATGCEACHGPASLHVADDGDGFILGADLLGALDEAAQVTMCTRCHADQARHWPGSPHDGSSIACAACHADQVHFAVAARPADDYRNRAEFCLQCHPDQDADFRLPFRHQVLEGRLDCEDCHDPHAGFDRTAWNGLNAACLECHGEVAGPFVYEHDGVHGEDCLLCHRPHGSHHDKLLVQEGNGLCMQCHYDEGFDSGFGIGGQAHAGLLLNESRCYDCHIDVHGSNVSPTFQN